MRIPAKDNDGITYLPIDSKFPMEDYIRLSDAAEQGNYDELEKARKALENRVKDEAKLVKNIFPRLIQHRLQFFILQRRDCTPR